MLRGAGAGEFSLKDFLTRSKVIALYRGFVRATRPLPSRDARWETIAWFRDEFERSRGERDADKIQGLLQQGRLHLKSMQSSIGMATARENFEPLRGRRIGSTARH